MIPILEIDRTLERPLGQSAAEDIMVMAEKAANGNPADIDALLICCDELEWRNQYNSPAYVEIRQLMSEIHVGEVQEKWHEHRVGAGPWRLHPIDWYLFTSLRIAYPQLRAENRVVLITCMSSYLADLVQGKTISAYMSGRPVKNLKIGWCSISTAIR